MYYVESGQDSESLDCLPQELPQYILVSLNVTVQLCAMLHQVESFSLVELSLDFPKLSPERLPADLIDKPQVLRFFYFI